MLAYIIRWREKVMVKLVVRHAVCIKVRAKEGPAEKEKC